MVHFLFYASKAYSEKQGLLSVQETNSFGNIETHENIINKAISEAVQDGYQQERYDSFFSKHSAYSYEDLPSDKYGAIFGARYFNPDSNMTFGEQLESYLTNELKATTPDKAPNYNELPNIDDGTPSGIQNKTTKPMFIEVK